MANNTTGIEGSGDHSHTRFYKQQRRSHTYIPRFVVPVDPRAYAPHRSTRYCISAAGVQRQSHCYDRDGVCVFCSASNEKS
jgi:hypothetical protein